MSYAIEAQDAIYFFVIEDQIAMVTKFVRKGCKGFDQSTKCSVDFARRWYQQLCDR